MHYETATQPPIPTPRLRPNASKLTLISLLIFFFCNVPAPLAVPRTSLKVCYYYCLRYRRVMLSYDHKWGHLRSAVIVSFSFPRPLFVGNVIRCCSNVSLVCSCWPQLIPTQHVALAGRPSHDLISLILSGCWGTVLRYCCSTVRGIHRYACCCLWLLFKKRYRHFIFNCASVRVWRLSSAQNLKRNTFMLHCYICLPH